MSRCHFDQITLPLCRAGISHGPHGPRKKCQFFSQRQKKGRYLAVPSRQCEVLVSREKANGDPFVPKEEEREAEEIGKRLREAPVSAIPSLIESCHGELS